MASPGMLQSGLSRDLFELWCPDKKNCVLIPGYVVEGTLAKEILSQPKEVTALNGSKLPLNLSVEYISFSAHVDFPQNAGFIEELGVKDVVLVHGEANEMQRLKSALVDKFHGEVRIYTPRNCETIALEFHTEKRLKVLGSLAEHAPKQDHVVSGVLVAKDYKYSLIAPHELEEYTVDIVPAIIEQSQIIHTSTPFSVILYWIENMFGASHVKPLSDESGVTVFDSVTVLKEEGTVRLEWESSCENDIVADSIMALVVSADIKPASVKCESCYSLRCFLMMIVTKSAHSHHHGEKHEHEEEDEAKIEAKRNYVVSEILKGHFGNVDFVESREKVVEIVKAIQSKEDVHVETAWKVEWESQSALVYFDESYKIVSADDALRARIQKVIGYIEKTMGDFNDVYVV